MAPTPLPPPIAPVRSSFVTVVAWIFIIFSGFTTFVSALQNVMIRSMPFERFNAISRDSIANNAIPAAARFMFAHIQFIVLAFFLLSAFMLTSSVGLLRRQNWARIVFIVLLAVGIVYVLGGLFVQQSFMSSMNKSFGAMPVQDSVFRASAAQFGSMFRAMRIIMAIFSLGVAAGFAWIVARLISPGIRAEFTSHAA